MLGQKTFALRLSHMAYSILESMYGSVICIDMSMYGSVICIDLKISKCPLRLNFENDSLTNLPLIFVKLLLLKDFIFILFLNSKHGGYRSRSPCRDWRHSCNHCLRDLPCEEEKPKGCSNASSL